MNNLKQKAMLVQLRISMWTGRSKDNAVTEEVCLSKQSEHDAGAWWTYMIPKKDIQPIEKAAGKCRAIHKQYTLPWLDGGIRLLPADAFMDYRDAISKAKNEFYQEVEAFLQKYPSLIATAKQRLGKLANNKYLPTAEIRDRYEIKTNILPFPTTHDFRVDLTDEDNENIRNDIESSIKEMSNQAMMSIWEKLGKMVQRIEDTLKDPDKKFKNSLINNLSEFCELIPKLNFAENQDLENIRKEVVCSLAKLKPDDLRENKQLRRDTTDTAKKMLEKMKSYM